MMAIQQNQQGGEGQGGIVLTPQQVKARRQRNIAIALVVALFAVLFYAVTIAKLGPGVLQRPD